MTVPTWNVSVDFTDDPSSAAAPTWTDVTSAVQSVGFRRGRSHELTRTETGTGSIQFKNTAAAFDPTNTSSPYYPNVLPMRRTQVQATYSGVPYTLASHMVERWPQQWDTQFAFTPTQTVDGCAALVQRVLASILQEAILYDKPAVYLPLTEANTATRASDLGVSGTEAPQTVNSKYGSGTIAFAGGNGPPAEGTQAALFTQPVSPLNAGSIIKVPIFRTVSSATGRGVVMRVNWTGTATFGHIMYLGSDSNIVRISLDGAGHLEVASMGTVLGSTAVINDGQPYELAVTLVQVSGTHYTMTAYVNGNSVGSTAVTWKDTTFTSVQIGGNLDAFANGPFTSGTYSHAAVYMRVPPATVNLTDHATAAFSGFSGDPADTRIGRYLNYAGWTAARSIDPCTSDLSAANIAGQTAFDAIQDVAAAEGGVFYVNGAGTAVYTSRHALQLATFSFSTFGEDTTSAELPYLSVSFDYDPTYIYNDVRITRTGDSTAVASDDTSQSRYFTRTLTNTINLTNADEAQDTADWLLGNYKDPHLRVASISFDAYATANAWPALLPREIGDRVTVKRRTPGNTITGVFRIEQIDWQITPSVPSAICTFALSPISVQPLIWDDTTFGVWDTDGWGY